MSFKAISIDHSTTVFLNLFIFLKTPISSSFLSCILPPHLFTKSGPLRMTSDLNSNFLFTSPSFPSLLSSFQGYSCAFDHNFFQPLGSYPMLVSLVSLSCSFFDLPTNSSPRYPLKNLFFLHLDSLRTTNLLLFFGVTK